MVNWYRDVKDAAATAALKSGASAESDAPFDEFKNMALWIAKIFLSVYIGVSILL